MFYITTLRNLYASIKADGSIQECDKRKITELVKQLVDILVQY